ncbi:MAG: LETM1 domain-containing protein [Bacteroidota bacterium]
MNPRDKGWLKAYMTHRASQKRGLDAMASATHILDTVDPFVYMYHIVQPTGLMYGYPVDFIEPPHPRAGEWSEKDKVKVLLTEAFFSAGLFYHFDQRQPMLHNFEAVTQDILTFYKSNFRLYHDSSRTFLGKRKDPVSQLEYVLDKRISIQYDWRNFWTSFFHNSLLFFDLIFFVQWKQGEFTFDDQTLSKLGIDARMRILKVIAAAAHSDGKVTTFERTLFNFFLQSAHLPAPQKRKATKLLREGVKVEDIDTDFMSTWLLKKYFLELAILTIWAKRTINEEEEGFLMDLAIKMELSEQELLDSIDNVRGFISRSLDHVHYLQIKQNYRIVSERMIHRMRIIVRKNQRMIAEEIQESRELVYLLRQSSVRELSEEEWEKVREQLLDILRSIPAFAIFMLPFGSITLPILLRIIPKYILYPSSFRENETRPKPPKQEQKPS